MVDVLGLETLTGASSSSFTRPATVVNRTDRPCWQAATPRAVASIDFPVPLPPAHQEDVLGLVDVVALSEFGDLGRRDRGRILEVEGREPLDLREASIELTFDLLGLPGFFVHLCRHTA